jgi:hypothetical protein
MKDEERVLAANEPPIELGEHDDAPLAELGARKLEELRTPLPARVADLEGAREGAARKPEQGRDDAQKYAEARHFGRGPG